MNNLKKKVFELSIPSTESVTDVWLTKCGHVATLRFDYYDKGNPVRSAIRFVGAISVRTRSEQSCSVWHIAEAYDCLVEVTHSAWIQEVISDLPVQRRAGFAKRHFMIYLDSAGCFEFLADRYDVLPEEPGSWESLQATMSF